jgi:hypothetical protein
VRVALCLVVLASLGCGGESPSVESSQLREVVLQPDDLPPGYQRLRNEATPRGWEARYDGPLVVSSQAELLASSSHAEAELDAELEEVRGAGWQPVGEPGLGDASFAATTASPRVYRVLWRDGEIIAEIRLLGDVPLSDVLELARKQERRITDVAG